MARRIAEQPLDTTVDRKDHEGGDIMSYRLLALAAASLLPLSVQAADMPKEGTDNFTNVWAMTISNAIQQGAQSFSTYEIDGVARNDAGSPMFNFSVYAA